MRPNHDDQPFFRKYEQATARLPVRDQSQTGRPDRPRRETAGREAGQERPVPVRQRKAVQAVLPAAGPGLTGRCEVITFRDK